MFFFFFVVKDNTKQKENIEKQIHIRFPTYRKTNPKICKMLNSLSVPVAIAFVSCISLNSLVNSFAINHRNNEYESNEPEHCTR